MLRRVRLRVATVLGGPLFVGLVLGVVEGVLVLTGAGASRLNDSFSGFAGLVPMFERETDAQGRAVMRTARGRATKHRDGAAGPRPGRAPL